MSDTTSAENPPEVPGFKTAIRLGGGLLVVLAIVLAVSLRDNANRAQLEAVREFSAVGDTHYAVVPDQPPPEPPFPPIVTLNGEPLFPVSYRKREKRDSDLVPVGHDSATNLTIYQTTLRGKDDANKEEGPVYFVKVGPGEFLKIHPQTPTPPAEAPAR